ncbi:MAG: hypothetical protein H6695_18080 [Deferribacteres bacterium]|nr:hypothetical protein [candidate division KSB1 bacterium]MCB9512093.1 hypothetical protein [Deferribacteres bacterium]
MLDKNGYDLSADWVRHSLQIAVALQLRTGRQENSGNRKSGGREAPGSALQANGRPFTWKESQPLPSKYVISSATILILLRHTKAASYAASETT